MIENNYQHIFKYSLLEKLYREYHSSFLAPPFVGRAFTLHKNKPLKCKTDVLVVFVVLIKSLHKFAIIKLKHELQI